MNQNQNKEELIEKLQEKGTTNVPTDLDSKDDLVHGTTNIGDDSEPKNYIDRGTTNIPTEEGIEADLEEEKARTTNVPEDLAQDK
ncbi:hypothetical protein OZX60_01910 [Streptococcaceae bacterium ESL0687]|nr:hypothetical protein OZX60_01910 [Streptococcaceae bacterium ESL0687]